MKLLLVGNHTCGNRGDCAILRGLLISLRNINPNLEIDIITRYPVSSSFLLGESLKLDTLHHYHNRSGSRLERLWKKYSRKVLPVLLYLSVLGLWKWRLPNHIQLHLKKLKEYDAVIHVGGSFFVDLYGTSQFEHSLCAILAKKPLYLLGHSVGLFQRKIFNMIAKLVFSKADLVSLREPVSLVQMQNNKIPTEKVHKGSDTAWLVPPTIIKIPSAILSYVNKKPTVAITLRELAPFDKRLGVSQDDYETAFSFIVNNLIKNGYQVVACSTCTGIDSYHKDDRMVALRVGNKVQTKEAYYVVMDELNDVELGSLLSYCKLTIGTRLHSAIISMNFNTPAIALHYEHKSEGVMEQLGLPLYSKPISSLFDGSLDSDIGALLENENDLLSIKHKVRTERYRAHKMVEFMLADLINKRE